MFCIVALDLFGRLIDFLITYVCISNLGDVSRRCSHIFHQRSARIPQDLLEKKYLNARVLGAFQDSATSYTFCILVIRSP